MAEDRKARLAALAARAGRVPTRSVVDTTDVSKDNLESSAIASAETEEPALKRSRAEEPETAAAAAINVDTRNALELALSKAQSETTATDTESLLAAAPKKINWDLKRDIQPKLDKLEKKTQKAIVEILRTRLEKQAEID